MLASFLTKKYVNIIGRMALVSMVTGASIPMNVLVA
jgi:hypothetical protein